MRALKSWAVKKTSTLKCGSIKTFDCKPCSLQKTGIRDADAATWSSRERRRLVVVSSLALIVVAIFTVLSFIVPGPVLLHQMSSWCKTADCRKHARLLTRSLNRSVDPCQDFEAALDDLSIAWVDGFEELLSKGASVVSVARKPLTLFRTCARGGPASEEDKWKFLEYIEEMGLSWPQKPTRRATLSPFSVLVLMALLGEMPLWMRIRVTQNPLSAGGHRIVVLPGRASYVRLFAANHERVMDAGDYSRYWKLIHSFLVGRPPGTNVDDVIKRSAQVQGTVVATLMYVVTAAPYSAPVLYNLSHAQQHASDATFGRWLTALSDQLKHEASLSLSDDVLFANSQFILAVNSFLRTTGDEDALVHISWQFVQMYAVMLDKALLEDIMGDKRTAASYLTMLCAREVEAVYSPLIAMLYTRLVLSSAGKRHANFVVHTLVQKAVDSVNSATWLEPDDRRFLATKLESVRVRLWPSDLFDDVPHLEKLYAQCPEGEVTFSLLWVKTRQCRRDLMMGPQRDNADALRPNFTPLASYDSVLNTVDVAIAALASPLYYTRGTLGMAYGGFGFVFALAMMGVLAQSRQYSHPNGSVDVSASWMSKNFTGALGAKLLCPNVGSEIGGPRGDAIAAVEVTQSVFRDRLFRSTQLNLTEELTDEKVFFLTLCRTMCVRKGVKPIPWLTSCNQLLRNFEEFSSAFGCSKHYTNKCKFFRND
ncbi:hypothetical protein V5799_020578 [Amblyomma americanum]|uniref:Peptidase M13 N-terminal domain-containing protein n=1 Tax=Amblyomma americanum TaxID=6943 RepID=A0AAQ4ETN9_AMBAM